MPDDASSERFVHLQGDDVSLLLDLSEGRLPIVLHWGRLLDDLDVRQASTIRSADFPPIGPNSVDVPVRISVLPEHHTGYIGRPGVSGSRSGLAWSPAFTTTTVHLDGIDVGEWAESGPALLAIAALDPEAGLHLDLDIELLPSGLIRSRATLTNTDPQPYAVENVSLAFPVPAHASELLDFAGRWGREKAPQRLPLGRGIHLREGRKGRTGADSATILHAGTPGFGFEHGEIWSVHTAWSGNHVHYAEATFDEHRVIGGGELLLPGEIRLEQGEAYTTPWVYGNYAVGLDAQAHRFHCFLRARRRPVGPHRPVTLNVWEAVYFAHDTDRLIDLAERAAALGVERYVLDDGWFGSRRDDYSGLGDWVVSQEAWPDGLHPLTDKVAELGMQFGLWFEPEMVNPDSDVARAYPEWIMSARRDWPVESRHQQVLNLAIPAAYAHVRDQILAILAEYPISYIKWDHNRDLIEAGDQTQGGRPAVHAQTTAIYRLLDEIRAEHPDLEIESCSSGGARVDLGVLQHIDRVWVSDCIDPLERQAMLRWTTQLLAPEFLGSHIASGRSHTTGRVHDLNFRAATALFGHLGIEWDLAQASDRALGELRAWIGFYKENRELLLTGDLVRIDDPGDGFLAHGVVAPDKSRALFAYVAVANPLADPGPALRLRGLDPHQTYAVRPVLVGGAPSGLVAPLWWGGAAEADEPLDPSHPYPGLQAPISFPGADFRGDVLAAVGVRPPRLHPDQAVLLRADAHPVPALSPSDDEPSSRP
ncbi:MAG: alpha-galactosidase [Tetrasphaera sp.]